MHLQETMSEANDCVSGAHHIGSVLGIGLPETALALLVGKKIRRCFNHFFNMINKN